MKTLPKGFSLVELLVVISIISILTALGVSGYNTAQKSARDARRKADLNQIANYLQMYYNSYGKYPPSAEGAPDGLWISSLNGDGWIDSLVSSSTNIAKKLPKDPINNNDQPWTNDDTNPRYSYAYTTRNSGQSYDLVTRLENTNDPDRCGLKDWKSGDNGTTHWCVAFGGTGSNQLYEASPDR